MRSIRQWSTHTTAYSEAKQRKPLFDPRGRLAGAPGNFGGRDATINEAPEGGCLLERSDVDPQQVLDDGRDVPRQVIHLLDVAGDRIEPRFATVLKDAVRPPAAFACDDLVTAFPIRPDGDRLHEPFRLDRVRELLELVDIEQLAGLIQVPVDLVNRDVLHGLLGDIDLSAGWVSGFTSAVTVVLNVKHGWAAEPAIYGRFGYGLATLTTNWTLDTEHATLTHPSRADGRIRLVDKEVVRTAAPAVGLDPKRTRNNLREGRFKLRPPREGGKG